MAEFCQSSDFICQHKKKLLFSNSREPCIASPNFCACPCMLINNPKILTSTIQFHRSKTLQICHTLYGFLTTYTLYVLYKSRQQSNQVLKHLLEILRLYNARNNTCSQEVQSIMSCSCVNKLSPWASLQYRHTSIKQFKFLLVNFAFTWGSFMAGLNIVTHNYYIVTNTETKRMQRPQAKHIQTFLVDCHSLVRLVPRSKIMPRKLSDLLSWLHNSTKEQKEFLLLAHTRVHPA